MKWVQILPEYIKALAIIVGAGWAYWKFIYQRQREPATDIDIDVRFVGVQKEKWVIEVTCVLENKSLVRHTYRDFQVTVRYLEATDEITDGSAEILYQLKVPKTIDDRIDKAKRFFAGVDRSKKQKELTLKGLPSAPSTAQTHSAESEPSTPEADTSDSEQSTTYSRKDAETQRDRHQNYINPRQQFHHRYVTWIPGSASFVWVQCKFNFSLGWRREQKMNSQRVFRVPDVAENKEIKDAEDKLNSSVSNAA